MLLMVLASDMGMVHASEHKLPPHLPKNTTDFLLLVPSLPWENQKHSSEEVFVWYALVFELGPVFLLSFLCPAVLNLLLHSRYVII